MLSCFRYALAALFLSSILISCSGKEEEEPTIDRFVLLKIGLEWEKEQHLLSNVLGLSRRKAWPNLQS